MAAYLLQKGGVHAGTLVATVDRAGSDRSALLRQYAADYIAVALELARDDGVLTARQLAIEEAHFGTLDLEDMRIAGVNFDGVVVDRLIVGEGLASSDVHFSGCTFQEVHGVQGEAGLPAGAFERCTFERFDDASTNAAVLRLNLSPPMKALLTVLRKLYLQAGGGRKVAALRRGLPGGGAVYDSIGPVLKILENEGMVAVDGEVAHPVRKHTGRIHSIIASGAMSKDPVVASVMELARKN